MIPISLGGRSPLIVAFFWSLLHFLWQGTMLAGALIVCLNISRGDSANRRYMLCCATLAMMSLCPVFTFACLRLPSNIMILPKTIKPVAASLVTFHGGGVSGARPMISCVLTAADRCIHPILVLWSVGTMMLLGRICLGLIEAGRLKQRSATRLPDSLRSMTSRLSSRLGVTCPRLLTSSAVTAPIVVGWLQPIILFPSNLLADVAQDHLESVLAHELAHIRRRDYLLNLLQAVIEALLFFHPAVWWVSKQIRREREYCCDDLAVQISGSPLIYAKALRSLEEQRSPANPQLSINASGGNLTMRIARLLKQQAAKPGTGVKVVLATLSTVTVTMVCVLSILATDQVMAQTVDASTGAHTVAVDTRKNLLRPDMSCTFYDKGTHSHAGVCEETSKVDGPFYCKQTDKAMEKQLQSGCEWKIKRLQDWERAQDSSGK